MTRLAFLFLFLSLLTPEVRAAEPADSVIAKIAENGHRNVAILPTVVIRNGDSEHTVGSLGPRGRLMAEELYATLLKASQTNGMTFKLVRERVLVEAMKSTNFRLKDLGNPQAIRKLSREIGADALITLTKDEEKDQILADLLSADTSDKATSDKTSKDKSTAATKERVTKPRVLADTIKVEILDTEDTFATFDADFADERTLSKAAYMGESWELRRWQDGKLTNVGINLEGNKAFGHGSRWEKYHYASLQSDLKHPFNIEGFPYHVGIFVDKQERVPIAFTDQDGNTKYVVALDPGEVYEIGLKNDHDRPVYVALYVDGVSTVDQQRREPEDLEVMRHWHLKENSGLRPIRGWFNIMRDDRGFPVRDLQQYHEFKVTDKDESVAFGAGFEDNIGQITAIFYTVGLDGIDRPSDADLPLASRGFPKVQFGTGLGNLKDRTLQFADAQSRGPMLAAVTVYYRTKSQLEALQNGTTTDPVVQGTNKGKAESDLPGGNGGQTKGSDKNEEVDNDGKGDKAEKANKTDKSESANPKKNG